jgi:hypothetical protein
MRDEDAPGVFEHGEMRAGPHRDARAVGELGGLEELDTARERALEGTMQCGQGSRRCFPVGRVMAEGAPDQDRDEQHGGAQCREHGRAP